MLKEEWGGGDHVILQAFDIEGGVDGSEDGGSVLPCVWLEGEGGGVRELERGLKE